MEGVRAIAIIETGFLTSATDRRLIVDDPERAARGISMGIIVFLAERSSMKATSLVPLAFPPMTVAAESAPLRYYPDDNERIAARLPAGTPVRATDEVNGWVELTVRGNFRLFGWMKRSELLTLQGG